MRCRLRAVATGFEMHPLRTLEASDGCLSDSLQKPTRWSGLARARRSQVTAFAFGSPLAGALALRIAPSFRPPVGTAAQTRKNRGERFLCVTIESVPGSSPQLARAPGVRSPPWPNPGHPRRASGHVIRSNAAPCFVPAARSLNSHSHSATGVRPVRRLRVQRAGLMQTRDGDHRES